MATTTSQTVDASSSSDPKVAASTLDFLLIELVPLAQRIATDLHAREIALLSSSLDKNLTLPSTTKPEGGQGANTTTTTQSTTTTTTTTLPLNDDTSSTSETETSSSIDSSAYHLLTNLGYSVGLSLIESLSSTSARPTTPLDKIKFICKDLWQLIFRKQIDNLKTNHRGTFVLTDNKFMALSRMSVDRSRGAKGNEEALRNAQPFLCFPCGVIRGALEGLGLSVQVHAETTELPQAVFQIRTVGSKV